MSIGNSGLSGRLSGGCQAVPEQMHKSGAGYDGQDIEKDSGAVSKKTCDISEDNLPHGVIRADVEHVDLPIRMEQEIEHGRGQTAGKKEADTFHPSRE